MISIAVCDDNSVECLNISNRIHALLLERRVEHTIKEFFDGLDLIESNYSFDFIFLDIKMKTDGLKTADLLRKRIKQFILIFITSYQEYVYEAFDVEAFAYILKPVDDKKLSQTLQRAVDKATNHQEGFIVINKNRQTIKVDLIDVIYFEISGRVITIHCNNYTIEYYEQIKNLEQKISRQDFFRCHKSYIINLNYVKKFNKNEIIMDNGDRVLLSKRKYDEFTKTFLVYIKKEGGIL